MDQPPPPETVEVSATDVSCNGDGPLGHPLVYLKIDPDDGWVDCPYCDRRFVLKDGVKPPSGH